MQALLDQEAMQSCPYDEFFEFGFNETPHKRFFAVKLDHHVFRWPSEDVRQFCQELFLRYAKLAREILLSAVPELDSLMETLPVETPGEISQSFMHLFLYNGQAPTSAADLPCREHTDSGLITIIPRATTPGLEILDMSTGRWVATETMFPECKQMATILVGETLAGLIRIPATVHRVSIPSCEPRISVPFQLRADALALGDSGDPDALTKARQRLFM